MTMPTAGTPRYVVIDAEVGAELPAIAHSTADDPAQTGGGRQIQVDHGIRAGKALVEHAELHAVHDPLILGDQPAMAGRPLLRRRLHALAVDDLPVVRVDVHDRDLETMRQLVRQGRLPRTTASDHRDPSQCVTVERCGDRNLLTAMRLRNPPPERSLSLGGRLSVAIALSRGSASAPAVHTGAMRRQTDHTTRQRATVNALVGFVAPMQR